MLNYDTVGIMKLTYEIMKIIKSKALSMNLTQLDIAKEFDVSLPTVKRWYAGKGIGLEQVNTLCIYLGLDFSNVVKSVESSQRSQFQYTYSQERYLSQNPDCLAFFDNLIRGNTVYKIKKKFSLSDLKVNKYLAALDKLSLIKWCPGDKAKLLVKGEPVWQKNGPLSSIFRPKILDEFLNKSSDNEKFILGDLLDEDIEIINEKLIDVSRYITSAIKRASLYPDEARPYGVFFQVKEYLWSFNNYLKGKK